MLCICNGGVGYKDLDLIEWHVGEALPEIIGRGVTFQADGDELECIVNALKATSKPKSVDELRATGDVERVCRIMDDYKKIIGRMIGKRIGLLDKRIDSIERIFNMEFLEEKE